MGNNIKFNICTGGENMCFTIECTPQNKKPLYNNFRFLNNIFTPSKLIDFLIENINDTQDLDNLRAIRMKMNENALLNDESKIFLNT